MARAGVEALVSAHVDFVERESASSASTESATSPVVSAYQSGDSAAPPDDDARAIKEIVSWNLNNGGNERLWIFGAHRPVFMHADERASVTGALRVMHSVFSGEMSSQLRIPTVEMGYHVLLATFCTSRYGLPTNWPEGFWDSTIGRFIYIAFWEAYGERLMLNQDVTKVLGIDLSRVGQVQRLGLLRYIENPWAMHRKQKRRRVTPQMAQRYLDEQRMAREDSQDNQGKLDDEYVLAGPRRRR